MGWFDSFFHPEKGYQKGQEELAKYFQQAQGFQQPIFNQGQQAYGNLSGAMEALLNPEALQNQWIQGYEESPSAQHAETMAASRGANAANSLGLGGSNTALRAIQEGTSQIGLGDRQNYLDNLMQKYLAGTGIAQGIYGQGANASNQLGQNAMNMGTNSANLAYGEQNAPGDLLSKILGSGVGLAGSALGGRFSQNNNMPWSTTGGR